MRVLGRPFLQFLRVSMVLLETLITVLSILVHRYSTFALQWPP